jgi:rRNA-processing protein EBP2
MAKKAKGSKNRVKAPREEADGDNDSEERLTLEVLDAVSVSSDDEDGMGDVDDSEWNAEALALRQAIADGAFDHLMKKAKKKGGDDQDEDDDDDDDDEEEAEEVDMDEDDVDEGKSGDESKDGDESDSDEEEDQVAKAAASSGKALVAVLEEMAVAKLHMPWAETFDVIPQDPLPFGGISNEGSPLDVHDDLKREVAFYNIALESVKQARTLCSDAGIPFSRPEDFFAEMVKSDGKINVLYILYFVCRCLFLFVHTHKSTTRLTYSFFHRSHGKGEGQVDFRNEKDGRGGSA